MGVRSPHAPARPPAPTDLEKSLAATPPYPGAYGAITEYVNPGKICEVARTYFGYMLMLGADENTLKADPYWKYMEDDE